MVRTTDTKYVCNCGWSYTSSNKSKHEKTKKHQEWAKNRANNVTDNTSSRIEDQTPSTSASDDNTPQVIDIKYWMINEPNDPDEVEQIIREQRSKYHYSETSKRYVNTTYYNYITSYEDIPFLSTESYKKSNTTYRTNFSLGIITESFDNIDGEAVHSYEIISPGDVYYFTCTVLNDDGCDKKRAFMLYLINKRHYMKMLLAN